MTPPFLVVSDCKGNIFEIPELFMVGASLHSNFVPDEKDIVPLPQSSVLFSLPKRVPVGYDASRRRFIHVKEYKGSPVFAAAGFMPPGYIRTLHAAYKELPNAPRLPLYCYSAIGWKKGGFFVAGKRIDARRLHALTDTELKTVSVKARTILKRYPRNRVVAHLIDNCVLKYQCPNACNFVLGRWECPIPVSKRCNAFCLGCISRQPKRSGFSASQHRIDFVPTVGEIIEYVVPHLKTAPHPVASFGQGCEGEPLLQAELVEESIKGVRARTKRGVININTNASVPDAVLQLCKAGLDSMRVSLNSAQPNRYAAYYRPKNYSFHDILRSISIARRYGVWVSINYLVFPGFTDHPSEMRALRDFIKTTKLNMIQTRNLNIDPVWYIESLGLEKLPGKSCGMTSWVDTVKSWFPDLLFGYFNPEAPG